MTDIDKSKVYIRVDGNDNVISIEGGYTAPRDLNGWIFIDEGYGDRYNLAQSHYLDKPLMDETGAYNYIYENGSIRELSSEEKEVPEIIPDISDLEKLEAQVMYTALMTDTLLDTEV